MASQDVLSKTLSSITAIKLDQLRKQNDSYKIKKQTLLETATSEKDPATRADVLLNGATKILPPGPLNPEHSNLDVFIEQSKFDPSVSDAFLKDREDSLRSRLDAQTNKYEFASLYGKLVEEWIAAGEQKDPDFVVVGREEMHQQRSTWEDYVFKPKETDAQAIRAYLDDVFSSKETQPALQEVRDRLKAFQENWDPRSQFNVDILKTCLNGMLRSDMLMEEKRRTLRDFLGNDVVLSEIADVLNVRMENLDAWAWDSPLLVEQRRNLNGRYRFYTDEDLLHSIFIYCIGLNFAVELRGCLVQLTQADGVWKPDTKPISKEDARRRTFFLGAQGPEKRYRSRAKSTVQAWRDEQFHNHILLDQLPRRFNEVRAPYGNNGEQEREEDTRKSHTAVVQGLLQQLLAELAMSTSLGKDMTVIRSDFTWFGPSIPHSSIFAVLEFFGINEEWLDFFKRVLEAPIRFKEDSADTPDRIRKRGTPISTPIADFFGESLLFCLDFAVNQKADGTRLYRLHDDIWLWGDVEKCAKAWEVITEFKDIVGLELNRDKTGSVRISKHTAEGSTAESVAVDRNLPSGDVTWGFLKLEPTTGRFVIRQDEIDKHTAELRLQLDGCKSVLDLVQAWNTYGYRFFVNNLGKPCAAYGRAHMDSMLETFKRIQEQLSPGGISKLVKDMISSRFGLPLDEIPDGFLYYPVSLGGLGLKNPFVPVLLQRHSMTDDPKTYMEVFHESIELEYHRAKTTFEENETEMGLAGQVVGSGFNWGDLSHEPFMSLEEYMRYAERTSETLFRQFKSLMEEPKTEGVLSDRGDMALESYGSTGWHQMSADDKWVVQLYRKEILDRFGGLKVVDDGLLPTGLITMLKESRFKWQG